ncbi:hypothetical protein FQA39_LY11168 [Lamprigera yunnana]|nr:hypothetical protein FQA39_LY11168 [Lamprigera yunnana]
MWCLITKLATNKWNVSTSFVKVLALTLVGCTASIPQIKALKCLILFYLVFVIVIHGTFKTNLAQLLTVDQYNSEIKNLEGLVDSDIPVFTYKGPIQNQFQQIIEDFTYTKIRERLIMPFESYKDILKGYTNCCYLLFLQHIRSFEYYSSDYNVKYRFIFIGHNYLNERLNNFIQRFVENGIFEHIISENNRKRNGYGKQKEEKSKPKVLTMHHAYGIFVIWAVGMELSIIVFIIEIVRKKFEKKCSDESSEEGDNEMELQGSDTSEQSIQELLDVNEKQGFGDLEREPNEGDYVLVEFTGAKEEKNILYW